MKPKINNIPGTTQLNSDNFAPGDMFVHEGEVFLVMFFDKNSNDEQETHCWDFQNNRSEIFVNEFEVLFVNDFSVSVGERYEPDVLDTESDNSSDNHDASSDEASRDIDEQLRYGDEDSAEPERNTQSSLGDVR